MPVKRNLCFFYYYFSVLILSKQSIQFLFLLWTVSFQDIAIMDLHKFFSVIFFYFIFLMLTILVSHLTQLFVTVLSTFRTNTLGFYSLLQLCLSHWRQKNTLKAQTNRSIVHLSYYVIHKLYMDNVFNSRTDRALKHWMTSKDYSVFITVKKLTANHSSLISRKSWRREET